MTVCCVLMPMGFGRYSVDDDLRSTDVTAEDCADSSAAPEDRSCNEVDPIDLSPRRLMLSQGVDGREDFVAAPCSVDTVGNDDCGGAACLDEPHIRGLLGPGWSPYMDTTSLFLPAPNRCLSFFYWSRYGCCGHGYQNEGIPFHHFGNIFWRTYHPPCPHPLRGVVTLPRFPRARTVARNKRRQCQLPLTALLIH